jgi:prevent-host-death family protein
MPTIRPVSDLRNNFTQISQIVHDEDEPIFLTKNGIGDIVVMSIEHYERLYSRIDLHQKLNAAEKQILEGAKGKDYKSVISKLRK